MRALRLVGLSVGALVGLGLAAVAVLLIYYRPAIEYAYVDILDGSDHRMSGWWVVVGALVLGAVALLVLSRVVNRRRR